MTAACSHCGGALVPGQPVCTDCGKATGDDPSRAQESPGGSAARPLRRDKSRDFSLVGKTVAGKYRVLEVLGQGGFGTVYLVEITAGMVGERLALKILPEELSSQPAFREQFLNEIRVAMRVVDRSIVQIRDVGMTDEGLLYYTMDFSPGITLAEVIRREGKLAIPRAILVVLNVLRALQTAHAAGIIHRDLKPANIMVETQGGKETVRVVDFGIATAVRADREKARGFAGSPHYMPPEQFMGEEIGFYTDIYPLGVTLYECITGRKPYAGSSPQDVFRAIKAGPPAPPHALHPAIAEYPGLSELILRALERNPERRFQSAKELFDALNAILVRGTSGEHAPPPRPQAPAAAPQRAAPAPRPRRRYRSVRRSDPIAGLIGLGVVAICVALGATVFRDEIGALFSPPPVPGPVVTEKPAATESDGSAATSQAEAARQKKKTASPRMSTEPTLEDQRKDAETALVELASKALEEARSAFLAKRWPIAVERADTVLAMRPGNLDAHRIRGLAALRGGDASVAANSLGIVNAASRKPDVEVLVALAEAELALRPPRSDLAEEHARAALKEDPKNPAAILCFARALELNGKDDLRKKVIGAARKGKVSTPEIDALWEKLFVEEPKKVAGEAARVASAAREAAAAGDRGRAAELAAEWIRLEPSEEAHTFGAEALLEAEKPADAKALLEGAIGRSTASAEADPPGSPSADAKRLEALLHVCEGKLALEEVASDDARSVKAENHFQKAVEALAAQGAGASKRHQALARLGLARARAGVGTVDDALEALKPLAGSLPADLLLEEGKVLLHAGQKAEGKPLKLKAFGAARKSLLAISRQRPSEVVRRQSHYVLGLVQLELGDWEGKESGYRSAVESFAAAKTAGLDSLELYESWSFAYDRLGQLSRAAQMLRTAFEKEPTPERCLRAAELYLKANPRSPDAVEILKQGTEKFAGDQILLRKYLELTR